RERPRRLASLPPLAPRNPEHVATVIPATLISRSFRATPRQTTQARQEGLSGLEDFEAGAAEALVELGRAQVAVLALPEKLERHGRQEPAQRSDRRAEPLGRTHLAKRREPGRTLVRQEDRVAARLQGPVTRGEERGRIRVPVQRVHAHQHVEVPDARHRVARDIEVLEGRVGSARRALLARDLDQVLYAVNAAARSALPGQT